MPTSRLKLSSLQSSLTRNAERGGLQHSTAEGTSSIMRFQGDSGFRMIGRVPKIWRSIDREFLSYGAAHGVTNHHDIFQALFIAESLHFCNIFIDSPFSYPTALTWKIDSNGIAEKLRLMFPNFVTSSRSVDEKQSWLHPFHLFMIHIVFLILSG